MANRWESPQHIIGPIDGRWTLAVLAQLQDGVVPEEWSPAAPFESLARCRFGQGL
jgi:hypothetical protein